MAAEGTAGPPRDGGHISIIHGWHETSPEVSLKSQLHVSNAFLVSMEIGNLPLNNLTKTRIHNKS